MKKLLLITSLSFLIVCYWGCKPTNSGSKDSEETGTAVPGELGPDAPQWITLIGSQGPGQGKHVVLVSGDEEYRSEEALPQMARILSTQHGFTCTVLFAQDPERPGIIDPNYLHNIPGMHLLDDADLMVVFTRFRELSDEQMEYFEKYLMAGKPVIGIRTATHAFNIKDSTSKWKHYSNFYKGEKTEWQDGFGRLVLGEKWISHHGHHRHQSTRGRFAPGAANHPITNGIADGEIWGPTDVYGVRLPLPGATPIILGEVVNRPGEYDENDPLYGMRDTDTEVATKNPAREASGNPNNPMMPVAWTRNYALPGGKSGKVFAATIGSSTDLLNEGMRRMYVNAVYWLMGMDVPEKATADIEGKYEPSPYAFHDDEHWDKKNLIIEALIRPVSN